MSPGASPAASRAGGMAAARAPLRQAAPRISPRARAPRAAAASSDSRTRKVAPSPRPAPEVARRELLRRAQIAELRADDQVRVAEVAEVRVVDGEAARRERHLADPGQAPRLRGLDQRRQRPRGQLGGEVARQPIGRKGGHAAHSRPARLENGTDGGGAARTHAADDADAGHDDPARHDPRLHLVNASVTFWPPKPNEFEIAACTGAARGTRGTQSNGTSGSTLVRLTVAGTTPWVSVSTVAAASRPPAAAIVWPIWDLFELTRRRPSPNTRASARASIRSFCGVPVPCAFA